jgi:hypothetical protein
LLTGITAPASLVRYQALLVVGGLHSPMFVVKGSWNQLNGFCPFNPFATVENLDRFNVVMAKKSPFMLPSEPSDFCRYHSHMEICMDVSVPNVPRRIN